LERYGYQFLARSLQIMAEVFSLLWSNLSFRFRVAYIGSRNSEHISRNILQESFLTSVDKFQFGLNLPDNGHFTRTWSSGCIESNLC